MDLMMSVADHDVHFMDSSASFHMNPHREWFNEYEKYNASDVFLREESIAKIIGHRRVKLLLKNGRIRTLPRVLHILYLSDILISISMLDDVGVDTCWQPYIIFSL
jgi:hypothetical protein